MQFIFRSTIVLTLILMTAVAGAKAQKLFFIFAHGQYASPLDANFKDNYSYGLGAEGGVGIGTGKTFFIGTIGYTYFNDRAGSGAGNLTYVPMKIGVRHYLLPGKLIFIQADAGIGTINNKSKGGSTSRFTGDIGAGVKLGPLEVGVSYDGFSRSDPSGYASWLAFKAGWRIGL
jgi:hypothetical protein